MATRSDVVERDTGEAQEMEELGRRRQPEGSDRAGAPDVLLDVPNLKVEEISLEVRDLHARIALEAKLADLVQLHVGADVDIADVVLEIKGVEAEAHLVARLDNVVTIIDRALSTVNEHPEILVELARTAGRATEQIGEGVGAATDGLARTGEAVGEGVGELGKGAGEGVGQLGEGAGELGAAAGQAPGETVEQVTGGEEQESGNGSEAEEPESKAQPRQGQTRRRTTARSRRTKAGSS